MYEIYYYELCLLRTPKLSNVVLYMEWNSEWLPKSELTFKYTA